MKVMKRGNEGKEEVYWGERRGELTGNKRGIEGKKEGYKRKKEELKGKKMCLKGKKEEN